MYREIRDAIGGNGSIKARTNYMQADYFGPAPGRKGLLAGSGWGCCGIDDGSGVIC